MGKPDATKKTYIKLYKSDEYETYLIDKEKIKSKYPARITSGHTQGYKNTISDADWELWLKYKNEIMNLLLAPDGSYQKFVWSSVQNGLETSVNSYRIRGKKSITHW